MTKMNIGNFIKKINKEMTKDQKEALRSIKKIEKRKKTKYGLIGADLKLTRERLRKLRQFEKSLNREIKKLEKDLRQNMIRKQKDIRCKILANKRIDKLIQVIKQTKKKVIALNTDMVKLDKRIEQDNEKEAKTKIKRDETANFMKKLRQAIAKKTLQEKLLMEEIKKLEKEEKKLAHIKL